METILKQDVYNAISRVFDKKIFGIESSLMNGLSKYPDSFVFSAGWKELNKTNSPKLLAKNLIGSTRLKIDLSRLDCVEIKVNNRLLIWNYSYYDFIFEGGLVVIEEIIEKMIKDSLDFRLKTDLIPY